MGDIPAATCTSSAAAAAAAVTWFRMLDRRRASSGWRKASTATSSWKNSAGTCSMCARSVRSSAPKSGAWRATAASHEPHSSSTSRHWERPSVVAWGECRHWGSVVAWGECRQAAGSVRATEPNPPRPVSLKLVECTLANMLRGCYHKSVLTTGLPKQGIEPSGEEGGGEMG